MKVFIVLSVSLFSVACATNVSQQDLGSAQSRALKQERAKNELLSRRLVHLTLVNAGTDRTSLSEVTAFGTEQPVDVSAVAAMRTRRRVARSTPIVNGCAGATPVVIKNMTGSSILLMVDSSPIVYVGPTFLTDHVGQGVTAHLCLKTNSEHDLSGGTYSALSGLQSPTRTFFVPLKVEAKMLNVSITESMLSGSSR